jgi:hypothetical protein
MFDDLINWSTKWLIDYMLDLLINYCQIDQTILWPNDTRINERLIFS